MNRTDYALQLLSQTAACSQAILTSFAEEFGLDKKMAHKLATGLGGGLGRKQSVCGAISAGSIVISLKYGSESPEELEKKEDTYEKVYQFVDEMEKTLGSRSCSDLLGIDVSTAESREKATNDGVFEKVCKNCVKTVADYLETEIIAG